ncbi:COR domain-containing protein [Candidatus Albibeggiatoa sp. nov. BB20]|uniref:COR domain-containing protein n=1 Tax=Candidatus Albibeggiatoa sp. nov. BB20 TaxID=3162723 RepID=UPI0033656A06
MQLMEKFELCFKMPNMEQESYLIADLLDPQEPDLNWDDDDCLRFEYHYDVLPNSVFSRFLVRAHKYISQKTYWLTGVMLAHENNKALIKADIEDKKS